MAAIKDAKKFAFLGYEVGGWGALLAFLISVVTLCLTAVDRWLLGPNPILRYPEQVNFTCQQWVAQTERPDICPPGNKVFLEANPITLINNTSAPHSFTAVHSDVVLNFMNRIGQKNKSITLDWFYFGNSDPIAPLTVAPQENISKEIDYYARRTFDSQNNLFTGNFLPFRDFESLIKDDSVQQIELVFRVELLDGLPLTAKCYVPIDEDLKAEASFGTRVQYSRVCFGESQM